MPLVDATLRNAAVLVSCLDEADADGLLGLLGPLPAGRIRDAMSVLGTVSRSERDRVIRAFLLANQVPSELPTPLPAALGAAGAGGVEVDERLARQFALSSEHERAVPETGREDTPQTPFAFLLETDADVVAPFLARESPQTVAVVLSYLRRSQAGELLKRLEPPFQAQVLGRLAKLEEIDPGSIRVVAEELRAWIVGQHEKTPRAPLKGDGLLRDMLAGGRERDRAELIAELLREANPIARRRKVEHAMPPRDASTRLPQLDELTEPQEPRRSLEFDDLMHLTSDDLLRTFQSVPRDVLTLALVGADEGLIRRITQIVSRREAKQIKRNLRLERPTRLDDIEFAKRRVAQIATQVVYGSAIIDS